jgi:acetate kinase
MREIVASLRAGDARAKLAFDIFVHRLRSGIGAMVAVLGGMDALIFSAGIGENSAEVRAAACANFGYLKLQLDPAKNAEGMVHDHDISSGESRVRVLVIRAQEDWAIARDCWKLTTDKVGTASRG